MKTDRELLELAARAAGHNVRWLYGATDIFISIDGKTRFDPLTDDGDALRLAVKLSLDLNINGDHCDVFSSEGFYNCRDDDPYAATRRAIVRAAAAIGEAME